MTKKALVLIPARGGSKGIPHKNIKEFKGKPLICHAIDTARQITDDTNICVSTDDNEIIKVVEDYGLKVPFKRPDELATDNAGTYEVIIHALDYYKSKGYEYDIVILLQTTSPFRVVDDVHNSIAIYDKGNYEMVVTVKNTSANPYYDCFEPDENGYLSQSKGDGKYVRRQDVPKVYEYNGAVYVMNVKALYEQHYSEFKKVGFYEMDEHRSMDLDTPLDWKLAELLIDENRD